MSLINNTHETRILIANSHAILREKLAQVISEIPDVVVVAEAKNGDEVMERVNKSDFDLVILDIEMPDRNGLEILREIKRYKPVLPVLMLSMLPEKQYAGSMLKAGADGYITMDNLSDQMREAIQRISQGGKYFNASLERDSSGHPESISFREDPDKKEANFFQHFGKKRGDYGF